MHKQGILFEPIKKIVKMLKELQIFNNIKELILRLIFLEIILFSLFYFC
jgi:hypothetical protein